MVELVDPGGKGGGVSDDMTFIEELYAARYRRLVGQLAGPAGGVGAAEEVVQEAFMTAVQRPRAFRRQENPEAWLRAVAVSAARSRWRRTSVWRAVAPRVATSSAPDDDVTEEHVPDDHVPDGHHHLPPDQLPPEHLPPAHQAVLDAVLRLPPDQRDAVALHDLADLSLEQVAQTLGTTTSTAHTRLSRGREALMPVLAELASAPPGRRSRTEVPGAP